MRDGAWRVVVKGLARWVKTFDLRLTRWALARRGEPRYRLTGSCNGCGKCCEAPSQPVSRFTWHVPTARRLFLWWQRVVNGFEVTDSVARSRVFVFRCTHFDRASRQCDSYASRPLMCRDYPVNLTFEAVPELFPECSYGVEDKKAAQLKAALIAAGITGEKLTALEKKLFLSSGEEKE